MQNSTDYKRRFLAKFGVEVQVQDFVNAFTAAKHTCPKCKSVFSIQPKRMIDQTLPYCARCTASTHLNRHHSQAQIQFDLEMAALVPGFRCTTYNGNNKLCEFACVCCGATVNKLPRALLAGQVRCASCTGTPSKGKVADKKTARLFLQKVTGKRVDSMHAGNVPVLEYKIRGKAYSMWADFKIGNTLVEERSIAGLWRHWKLYIEHAKASVKAGMQHRMLINDAGRYVALPVGWHTKPRIEIEAYLALKLPILRILSIDPGTTNAAWAVSEYNRKTLDYKLVASGKLLHTISDLTAELAPQIREFSNEVQNIVDRYHVSCVGMERYQARGMKGTTIELVNIMIGAAVLTCMDNVDIPLYRIIPASQWKNAWNRIGNLEQYYADAPCVIHQADAIGIGIYCMAEWFGFGMESVMGTKALPKLLKQIKATDTMTKGRGS